MRRMDYFKVLAALFVFVGFCPSSLIEEGKTSFTVGTLTAEPGEIKSGYVLVPQKSDPGCEIPVTIINGKR
ncbi:MAG: hypothetical protein PVI11_02775, partial [Candidatus Aminicenantes bacterium]